MRKLGMAKKSWWDGSDGIHIREIYKFTMQIYKAVGIYSRFSFCYTLMTVIFAGGQYI